VQQLDRARRSTRRQNLHEVIQDVHTAHGIDENEIKSMLLDLEDDAGNQ